MTDSQFDFDSEAGFFKLRDIFGWSETEARSKAWRGVLRHNEQEFSLALRQLKSLDFRHGPSGVSLLGLVLFVENGSDDLDTPLLRAFLSKGGSLDMPLDESGDLALIRCAKSGRVDAALLLLDKGASSHAKGADGQSLIDLAKAGHSTAQSIQKLAVASGNPT